MEAFSTVSTPQDQIKPSEPDSNHSILQGLRERRDRPGTTAALPGARCIETPLPIRKRRWNATTTINSVKNLRDNSQSKRQKSITAMNAYTNEAQQNEPQSSSPDIGDKGPLISYKDVTAAFAIDVSASTKYDGVLIQEKKTILDLSSHLSSEANARARVLPWHGQALPPIKTHKTSDLSPGSGTNPTVLIADTDHRNILQNCSLWCLLTDGEISSRGIRNFALGVSEKGLHGKACVVILFSARPRRPVDCNISVGQAVFAVAPDCAFLFHDVNTEEIYILQCKGCFRSLLPSEQADVVIDNDIRWKDIPRISYDELARIAVPQPREVDNNTIIIASGRKVNLDDLYGNKLHPEIAAEILDNDDNLKSVLLGAQNAGKSREIENWVSKQRVLRKGTAYVDRPDLYGSSLQQIRTLVNATKGTVCNPDVLPLLEALKQNLRESHQRNWTQFIHSVGTSYDTADRRNVVVDDALARVRLNRESPSSPMMMSPVSPQQRNPTSLTPAEPYRPVIKAMEFSPTVSRTPPPAPKFPYV